MASASRVLVVFVDALGPLQLAQSARMRDVLRFQYELRGEAGFSSGALATVLTGRAPEAHGRLCLFSARTGPESSPLDALSWLRLLPRALHERAVVRRHLSRWLAREQQLTGYFALHRVPPELFAHLDVPERDDLFTAAHVGGAPTFLARARAAGLTVYASPWQRAEDARRREALAALRKSPADLTFLYAAELDGALHTRGNDVLATRVALDGVADWISSARDALAVGGARVTTLVVGDHGMADVTTVIDPRVVFDRPVSASSGVRVFLDSTIARIWGPEASLERLRAAIERARWPGRWMRPDDLARWGVATAGAPWGDAWFQLDEGALFAPSHVGGRARGMHGYGPDARSGRAAFASDTPLDAPPASLRDVSRTVMASLGGLS